MKRMHGCTRRHRIRVVCTSETCEHIGTHNHVPACDEPNEDCGVCRPLKSVVAARSASTNKRSAAPKTPPKSAKRRLRTA